MRKLARDFNGFNILKMLDNCIELGHIANNIIPIGKRWSMQKLVDQFVFEFDYTFLESQFNYIFF